MTTMLEQTTVAISMELPCQFPSCRDFAEPLFNQLNTPHYSTGASVMECPASLEEWRSEHRTARRAALRAERLGYRFAEVDNSEYATDIYRINTSRRERQGRPMASGYTIHRTHRTLSNAQTRCRRHRTHTYGVLFGETLVAYLTLHRAGDLAMVSMILGHGDHEPAGIMYLLIQGVIADQVPQPGVFYYNLHSSGGDGLRFKKERYGFRPSDIEWSLT